MTIRVLAGALWLLTLALPAAAQWQPLDGGSTTTAAPPSTPAPSYPSTAPSPGTGSSSGGGIPGWTSSPSYGGSATPTPAVPPATGTGTTTTPPATPPVAGTPPPPPAVGPAIEISYSGQANADPRRASMKLRIVGNQVTAHVSMQSICAQNVRVGGADIDLVGALGGIWESAGASIDGSWTGVDHHCGSDDPNQGQFKLFFKDAYGGKKILHLRVNGKNGQYGWNFTPTGKVYTGDSGGGPGFAALGTGFTSPIGRPGPNYRTGAGAPAVAGNQYADQLRRNFLGGVITLQVGNTYLQSFPGPTSSRLALDPQSGRTYTNTDTCRPSGSAKIYMEPSSLADVRQVGNAAKLTGRAKGKGELWIVGNTTCKRPDGSSYSMKTVVIYIVLVGSAAIDDFRQQQGGTTQPPATPPGDIGQAGVSGTVRMVGTGQPVAGATITLVTPQGGAISDPSWRTDSNGNFALSVGAGKNLRSGHYEVVAQKLGLGSVPGQCAPRAGTPAGVGNDCDLWSVRRHYVTITRDQPNAGAGIIEMNFVRNIDFPNRKAGFDPAIGGGNVPLPAPRRFK